MKDDGLEISSEEAIRIYDSGIWKEWDDITKVNMMMYGRKLCMPFDEFHAAIERVLGRPVFTHEFGFNEEGIFRELEGKQPAPTLEEIINMIPTDKRIIVVTE
jgi:hypothetical protein